MREHATVPLQVLIQECGGGDHRWWLAVVSEGVFTGENARGLPTDAKWCGIFPSREAAERAGEEAARQIAAGN